MHIKRFDPSTGMADMVVDAREIACLRRALPATRDELEEWEFSLLTGLDEDRMTNILATLDEASARLGSDGDPSPGVSTPRGPS